MRQYQIMMRRVKTGYAIALTVDEAVSLFGLSGVERNGIAHGKELTFKISLKRTDNA
jgi:hypothetical protein